MPTAKLLHALESLWYNDDVTADDINKIRVRLAKNRASYRVPSDWGERNTQTMTAPYRKPAYALISALEGSKNRTGIATNSRRLTSQDHFRKSTTRWDAFGDSEGSIRSVHAEPDTIQCETVSNSADLREARTGLRSLEIELDAYMSTLSAKSIW